MYLYLLVNVLCFNEWKFIFSVVLLKLLLDSIRKLYFDKRVWLRSIFVMFFMEGLWKLMCLIFILRDIILFGYVFKVCCFILVLFVVKNYLIFVWLVFLFDWMIVFFSFLVYMKKLLKFDVFLFKDLWLKDDVFFIWMWILILGIFVLRWRDLWVVDKVLLNCDVFWNKKLNV